MPELWGGVHGNDLVLQLLKSGYDNVIAAVASYSDPETTVRTAEDLGYRVANFLAMGLDFGPYSSEPKVREPHPPAVRRGPRLGRARTATWSPSRSSPGTPTSPATAPTSCSARCSSDMRAPRGPHRRRVTAAWRSRPGRTAAARARGGPGGSSSAVSSGPPTPASTRSRASSSSEA